MRPPDARTYLSIVALLVVGVSYAGLLDRHAGDYADAAFKRALVTFAVARTLNGVISVAQETELALQPAGVGVTLAPGELLDPVNDLVERFAWVMLASTTALGIEQIMLRISAWWGMNLILTVAAMALLVALWAIALPQRVRRTLFSFAVTVLFVRFAIPALLILTGWISTTFLQADQARATAALRESTAEVQNLSTGAQESDPDSPSSITGRLSRLMDKLPSIDLETRIEALRERLTEASEHIIRLIASFVLETIVVPLVILWLLLRALRGIARLDFSRIDRL